MARRYFGTDGVRGVYGEVITPDLAERLARAATLWSGAQEVFVGRDTRSSGPTLEEAVARGVVSGGGTARIGGVLPTPAVALEARELGVVISASHNPPEYNGIKFFRGGAKLSDDEEEAIESLLDEPAASPGSALYVDGAADAYVEYVLANFGSDLSGLRIAVDCAQGAYYAIAPHAFERLGAEVGAMGVDPNGDNINMGCGATDTMALEELVAGGGYDLGIAFDGDGDRMLAVDENGETLDGDQILAILALDLGVDLVAVTTMTNLGFHALMREHGIRVVTTDVGDRYVLEALERENGLLGGEQSGHIIYLRDHVTGDGLAAALLLCAALRGRKPSEAAAVLQLFPQHKENIRVRSKELTQAVREAVDRVNAQLGERGRALVRPSGTEPLIRVLVEAENEQVARDTCASLAALVESELG
ncbi:MAG: phosphoglucosamine mutase [Actinobacteria bacterium]|nr:phosphoglucosamine mutase [Actinomycetota bacterium]MBV8394746.1 phosphoglucosamine mutase [Actinomycetota bacterium]MBV8598654.1 phosphoglucosamine mutase [Actinomycetota bacterium]